MTSTKMTAPIMVQHGILLDLLNLRTHLPGIIPHTNQTGRQTMTTTRDARIKTSTWQDWDTWGKWGDGGITNRIHPDLVHVFQQHLNLGPNLSRHSLPHTMAPQANARNLPNPCGNIQSDQAHHSWSGTPIQKGHIKVSLKDDNQRDWINKVRFALNSKQRMRAACELTDA